MLKHIPSDVVFKNRKQAYYCMGRNRLDLELSRHNFQFYDEDEDEDSETVE